jgi:putative transposase
MPRPKKPAPPASAPELDIPKELLDQSVSGPMTQGDLETMFRSLKKAVIERTMSAEMTEHLGDGPGQAKPDGQRNHRNGASPKTVLTDDGPVRIEVPRDRAGSFEPQIIGKHERRFTGFDQKIVAMYARGMTVREIQGYLQEMYGTEVSPEFVSKVTDEVMAEVVAWQSRPLDAIEDLTVPDDLAQALDRYPEAARYFSAFPRSAKRGILEWIARAKTAPTRTKRIEDTARLADRNERANQWRPKDAG